MGCRTVWRGLAKASEHTGNERARTHVAWRWVAEHKRGGVGGVSAAKEWKLAVTNPNRTKATAKLKLKMATTPSPKGEKATAKAKATVTVTAATLAALVITITTATTNK